MGWFSWLFEENEGPPEPLVLGARLRCPYGQHDSYLFVDSSGMDIHGLPQACVDDCKPILNILPFGECYTGRPCETEMMLWEQWENPEPQREKVNGKEIITTKSILVCNRHGHRIEVIHSGQDGIFARQIWMIREMESNYPRLKAVLDDPYGSVYLNEGMYEETIRFLEDRIRQHGGAVDLIAMYDEKDMEGAYINAALRRLMVTCDFKDIAKYTGSMQRVAVSHGITNRELNPLILNQDLLELIKLDSKEANERIGKKGFFRWQEENRALAGIFDEGINHIAYGLMVCHSAMVELDGLSRQQRDIKLQKKAQLRGEAKAQSEVMQKGGQGGNWVDEGNKSGSSSNTGVGNPVKVEGRGSTGRTIPNNLEEQMAMHQVQSNPLEGATELPIKLNDTRWKSSDGWVKMQSVVKTSDGNKITIHYVYNKVTGAFDDFKFK